MFEAVDVGRARAQFDALAPSQQREAEQVVHAIELNPWVDGVTKFNFLVPPLVLTLYTDGRWQITYRVVDDRFVEIYAISRATA